MKELTTEQRAATRRLTQARRAREAVSQRTVEAVAAGAAAGLSHRQIAKMVGLSHTTVGNLLREVA